MELLQQTSWEEARPYARELLMWLQDSNWPHAYPISNYLIPHLSDLVPEMLEILATDDHIWKANILSLLRNLDSVSADLQLRTKVLRLAQQPTPAEVEEGAADEALELARVWKLL